jgi:maleamate amidohydrolase
MDAFEAATYGARAVGYGERPALLIVDFQRGFTDPEFTMGKSERIHAARDNTFALVEAARSAGIPVASCYVGWQSEKDMQYWKIDALYREFFAGSPALEIDPLLLDESYDFTFLKSAPSMFFQTPIVPFLTKHRIDTAIVTGCVTSGCIRATAIDAFSYGYRTVVVDDCCGDPAPESHEANLRDLDRRYADIRNAADVIAYFEQVRGRNSDARSVAWRKSE